MRIVAVDGSPVRGGTISDTLEAAARAAEAAGADVLRVHLYEHYVRRCVGCMRCAQSGVCRNRDSELAHLAEEVLAADGLILACPSHLTPGNRATAALLERLASCFAAKRPTVRIPLVTPPPADKRAAIITASPVAPPFAALTALVSGHLRAIRRSFSETGVATVGSLSIAETWVDAHVRDVLRDRGRRLGRLLAAAA